MRDDAEFGGEHDRIAPALQCLADGWFVGVRTIHIGRIQESDPQRQRAVDQRNTLYLGGGTARIEIGQTHAAESEFGHGQALLSQLTRFHCLSSTLTRPSNAGQSHPAPCYSPDK